MEPESALPAPAPAVPASASLAGFWVRVGAYLVDMVLLMLFALLPLRGLGFLAGIAYKTIFISQGGQTPGKMAAGIRVVAASGEPVGIGRALARAVVEYVNALTLGLGYLIAAAPPKRALHDYIAGTRVVYLEGVGTARKASFAALGALTAVASLGLIVASASMGIGPFGKFKTLSQKAGEGATLGGLGRLRSALSISYGDAEGKYPPTLEALIPKYIPEIPKTNLADHPQSGAWTAYGAEVCAAAAAPNGGTEIDPGKIKDTGGWGYVADPKASCYGSVFVDCTHRRVSGQPWTQY